MSRGRSVLKTRMLSYCNFIIEFSPQFKTSTCTRILTLCRQEVLLCQGLYKTGRMLCFQPWQCAGAAAALASFTSAKHYTLKCSHLFLLGTNE